jgi:hypothetical protein
MSLLTHHAVVSWLYHDAYLNQAGKVILCQPVQSCIITIWYTCHGVKLVNDILQSHVNVSI